ncbi:terminase large subunit [Bajunvirus bajun]|uniref:Terminase large subunit n=1 Tax=Brevundimonas phage vB_BgoS-Bajun TaxID=2948594 RepID=A0A9E7SRM3_9CAUD|nr:terminase large subunit [Brevundimonas phage vB_BgoS-Bajun]
MSVYSLEERERARRAVANLSAMQTEAKKASERGLILPDTTAQAIIKITGSSELSQQVTALGRIGNTVQTQHLERLKPLAHDDFNAFCEYVNPAEAPASKWHIYLTGLLQQIEEDPDLERFVLNCPPGHAKPLHVDTPVLMGDGSWKRLGDIVPGDHVVSGEGNVCKVTKVHEQGVQPILRIHTKHGRQIDSAPDHSFRVGSTWKQAGDLKPGDPLDVVGSHDLRWNASGVSDTRMFRLAGYLSAQGGRSFFTREHKAGPKTYRNVLLWTSDPIASQDMQACLNALKIDFTGRLAKHEKVWRLRLNTAWGDDNAALFNIDQRANERRIPDFVFKGDHDQIATYLSTVFSLLAEAPDRYKLPRMIVYAKSPGFARDLQRLLAVVGVPSCVKTPSTGRSRVILTGPEISSYFAAGLTFRSPFAERVAGRMKSYPVAPALLGDTVHRIEAMEPAECRCLTVKGDHTFLAENVVVHNSTYASRLFVAWRLGRDPSQKIIGGGHSQRFVENEFSAKIRNLVRTPEYQNVFPNVKIDHATSAKDQWAIAGHGGQYAAKGAGQAIHGLRANFVCIDDPYPSIAKAESPTYREEVRTWFFGDVGSRLLPYAKVFLIMTRFHEEDLTGSIQEMNPKLPSYAQYHIVEAPALCYDPETDVLGRDLGEVLWDYYDLDYFLAKQVEWKYQRFALVYQQLADAASGDNIASKFLTYLTLPHLEPKVLAERRDQGHVDAHNRPIPDIKAHFKRVVVSVDAAIKNTERADYSVVQVWGETYDRKHYLIYNERKKVELLGLIPMIEKVAVRYAADSILVEDKGNGTAYIQSRGQTDSQRRLAPCPIVAIQVPSTQGKEFRFEEITPMIENGEVFIPETASWKDLFVREVGQFPDGANDDQVDAMTQYLRWAKTKRTRFGSKKVSGMG